MNDGSRVIRHTFDSLLARYGPQGWWPGDGVFEIMAGAVLVQRTAWRNAEAALKGLREAGVDDWPMLLEMAPETLQSLIRPSGFYRGKAHRLTQLGHMMQSAGGFAVLASRTTDELRARLLGVEGVGPETADAILLYAFDRPVFVVDAYARRLFMRLRGTGSPPADEVLKHEVESVLTSVEALNEFHALIVAHAKDCCRAKPVCTVCCLRRDCAHAND